MKSQIDLSFPELRFLSLKKDLDRNSFLPPGDSRTRSLTVEERQKDLKKIQNRALINQDFADSYFDSSVIPHRVKRFTDTSADNSILKPDEGTTVRDPLKSRNPRISCNV